MPKVKKAQNKSGRVTPYGKNPLIKEAPRSFGVGQDIQPPRDLTRFVKWPKYVRLQRQKRVLSKRLRVPPSVNQFTHTLDKNTATNLFKLLAKYRPETKQEKAERLKAEAEAVAAGKAVEKSKPFVVKHGLNHVTGLIEQKKATLVLIASDVDPIELVLWLPALCRKMGVPYAIVKTKSRLGAVVHQKTATCLAFTSAIRPEDKNAFGKLVQAIEENFNEKYEQRRKSWGGSIMGKKTNDKVRIRNAAVRKEVLAKGQA